MKAIDDLEQILRRLVRMRQDEHLLAFAVHGAMVEPGGDIG
jgi:hypothetical protein